MRKKLAAGILLLFLSCMLKAQDSCNCLTNLDSMIKKVSTNYAGYKDKVNAGTQSAYWLLVDSLRKEAGSRQHIGDCYPLLEKYRLYFYDKHLQLQLHGQQPAPTPATAIAGQPQMTTWTRQRVMENLQSNKRKLSPPEGIWHTEGYDIGIVFNPSTHAYDAIVLDASNTNWKAGMLKFTSTPGKDGFYSTAYYRGDFKKDTVRLNVFKNYMEVENYGNWRRLFPVSSDSITGDAFIKNHSSFAAFQFRYLNARTVYICLKSCDLSLKSTVDSTLASNREKLKTIPDWIVDFRGNDGGVTDVFLSLLPYLYTKPMIEKGSSHWMTPDNSSEFKKFISENGSLLDTNTLQTLNKLISFGQANPGGWYRDQGDTVRYDSVMPYPKRVGILADKNTVSSAETFLIAAKGLSDKVTILGENSGGYLDYGDLLPSSLPCNKLALYIPSRRANYLDSGKSYDRTGYPPDVHIPDGTKDWVQFVYDYWKKNTPRTASTGKSTMPALPK